MSDTTRDALALLLDQLLGDPETDTVTREFLARETATTITERYRVVPRSDITIEYGVEFRSMTIGNHRSADVARFRARSIYGLGDDAARERETWAGPWQPIPEDGDANA